MEKKNETLGRRIARLRLTHGMTQERLATELGVTPQAVSKWENDLSAPDIMLLPALARALDVTVDELLEGKTEREAEKDEKDAEAFAGPEPESRPESEPKGMFEPEPKHAVRSDDRPRTLHICVREGSDDPVDVRIPIGMATFAVRGGMRIPGVSGMLGDLDDDFLSRALGGGERGTILEVNDGDDHVTITLE